MQRALLLQLRVGVRAVAQQPWQPALNRALPSQHASLPSRLLNSTANTTPPQPPTSETVALSKKQLKWYLGLGAAGTLAVSAYSAESDTLKLAWDVPTRLIRDCATALTMIVGEWRASEFAWPSVSRYQTDG